MLRHVARNLLKADTTTEGSIKVRRKKAGWSHDYLAFLLSAPNAYKPRVPLKGPSRCPEVKMRMPWPLTRLGARRRSSACPRRWELVLSRAMAKTRTVSQSTFLRGVPIFGGLEGHSLERVVSILKETSFRAGATIFSEGELGREMYVLRDGEVEIQRESSGGKKMPIVRLGPGETFGEMTLVELQPRSATVVATKPVTALTLTNLDLYNLYRDDNYAYVIVLQNICRMLSRRLRKADGRICEFLAGPSKGKAKAKAKAKTPAKAKRPARKS